MKRLSSSRRHLRAGQKNEEKTLLERIQDLGREMCEDPRRRNRPSCVQFLGNVSMTSTSGDAPEDLHARLLKRMERRGNRTLLASKRAKTLEERLAELARGRKAW